MQVDVDKISVNNEFEGVILEDEFSEMLAYAAGVRDILVHGCFQVDSDGLVYIQYIYITAGRKTYKADLKDFNIPALEQSIQRRLAWAQYSLYNLA